MAIGTSFDSLCKKLKEVAFLNIGISKGTVASGDDSRIVNSLQKGNNLSDVPNKNLSLRHLGGLPFKGRLISSDNLNNIKHEDFGIYYSINPSLEMNYPNNVAGALIVYGVGNNQIQQYFELGRSVIWRRGRYDDKNWQSWQCYVSVNDNLESLTNKRASINNLSGERFFGSLGGTDLDTLKGSDFGYYFQVANSNATYSRGYPVGLAGSLIVEQNHTDGANGCIQTYISYAVEQRIFQRRYSAGESKWYAWKEYLLSDGNLSEVSNKNSALTELGIYDAVYPVGTLLMFANDTNPNTKFPRTSWVVVSDGRLIRSTTSKNAPNTVAGSDEILITEANLPQHSHTFSGNTNTTGKHRHQMGREAPEEEATWASTGTNNQGEDRRRWSSYDGVHTHQFSGKTSTAYAGVAKPILHLGASRFYKVWKRTA